MRCTGEGRRAVLLMLAGCMFFAAMATLVGMAHRADPGLHTAVSSFFRALVNLVVLVVMVRGDLRILVGDARPALWLRGVAGAAALLAYFGALATLGIGEAAFLNQTSSFWVAALAPLFLHERTRPAAWIAILGSMGGLLLLIEPRAGDTMGRLLGASSGLTAAAAYLSVRKASGSNRAITIVAWFTGTATLAAGAWVLAAHLPLPHDPAVLLPLCGAGVAATGGQLLMTRAYQLGPAAPVAAAGAASPLLTALLGALVLDQVPDTRGLIGMVVLFLCAVILPFLGTGQRGAPGPGATVPPTA